MSSKSIIEIINRFEDSTHQHMAEKHDLEKRIYDAERKKSEYSNDMERDVSNPESRIRLLNAEKELSDLKKTLQKKTSEYSDNLKQIRGQFLMEHNNLIVKSREKLKSLENEREKIRTELIPELERKISEYQDQKKVLDGEILKLITNINELEKEGEQWLQKM